VAVRRRAVVQRGVRVRPTTNWGRVVTPAPVTVAVGAKVVLATFALSNASIGEVVRRTRGRFMILSDQVGASEYVSVAFGMLVATDAAVTIGATAIPGPSTEANDDVWFVWENVIGLSQQADNITGAGTGAPIGMITDFDSKAMRRVEEGRTVVLMAENVSSAHIAKVVFAVSLLGSRIG